MDHQLVFSLSNCGLLNGPSFLLDKFHGDLYLTIKLLLPGVIKSVYNLNDKQIVKLFSRIFRCNQEEMVRDLEQVRKPLFPEILGSRSSLCGSRVKFHFSCLGFFRVTCQRPSGCSLRAVSPSPQPPKAF